MAYKLGDIFIGHFEQILPFGASPDIYSARYNLQGNPGIDFSCPTLTPILSAADGVILHTGFKEAGIGKFIDILHDGFITTYGHLNDISVKEGDKIIAGQLIGHSNQSGLCDTPRLHFGVAEADQHGNIFNADNGFGGYLDPMSSACEWAVKNLQEPVIPYVDTAPPIPVPAEEKSLKDIHSNSYLAIIKFLQDHGYTEEINPADPHTPTLINSWLFEKLKELDDYNNSRQTISPALDAEAKKDLTQLDENGVKTDEIDFSQEPTEEQLQFFSKHIPNFFGTIVKGIGSSVRDFIFVKK